MNIHSLERDRIVIADALRGFALMGLFIVHMVEYFELYWYQPEPGWVHNLIFFLFGGKAYGIFALLFGLSFHIMLDNYQRRGVDFRWRFSWRITLLLVTGYLHSLLYAGDILQLLALCGFLLVLCHRLSAKALLFIAAFFLIQVPHLLFIFYHSYWPNPHYQQPLFWHLMANNFDVFANGSFSELIHHNVIDGQKGKWAFFLETGRLWNIIGLMFVGALLGRYAFFERTHKTKTLLIVTVVSLVIFTGLKLVSPSITEHVNATMAQWGVNELMGYYINLSLITAGISIFILLFQTPLGGKVLSLFASAGKITLTLYLAQSVIFIPLFYGFGLAWFLSIGQFWSLMLGVLIWLLQMLIAIFYLRHHRYGPLEWLWRKATFVGFNQPPR